MQNRRTWTALALTALCLDLSGNYVIQGEDGRVHISITQHQCDRITIVRKSTYLGKLTTERHTLTLDGVNRKDTPWFGSREQGRTSARFVGAELQVKTQTSGAALTLTYTLNPTGDLLEETGQTGVAIAPMIAKREK
ncbi:MAG: hypothetical protein ABI693_25740 [Bryobacteraceae bacterium]